LAQRGHSCAAFSSLTPALAATPPGTAPGAATRMDPPISAAGTPRGEAGQAPGDAGTTGDGSGQAGMAAAAQRDGTELHGLDVRHP